MKRRPTQQEMAAAQAEAQSAADEARALYETVPQELRELALGWKRQYPSVFAVRVIGKWYGFHGATLGEVQNLTIMGRADIYGQSSPPHVALLQEHLIRQTLLYPDDLDLDGMLQGEVSALFKSIIEGTGFSDLDRFLGTIDTARNLLPSNIDDTVTAFVCKAFGMSPAEIGKLDLAGLARHIVMAEFVLGTELPLQVKNQLGPTQEQLQLAREQAGGRAMRDGVPRVQPGTHPGIPPRAQPPVEPGMPAGIPARAQQTEPLVVQPGVKPSVINTEQENAEMQRFLSGS